MDPEFADHIEPDPQQTTPGKARRKRLGEVESQTKAPQPEAKPRRRVLGEIAPQVRAPEPTMTGQALVDIETAQAYEPATSSKSGRPRLANTEPLPEEPQPQPQPKPGRPRLTDVKTLPRAEDPPFVVQPPDLMDLDAQAPVQHPGLIDLDAQVDMEPPSRKQQHAKDGTTASARPKTRKQPERPASSAHPRPTAMEAEHHPQEQQPNPPCPRPTNALGQAGLQQMQHAVPQPPVRAETTRCETSRTNAAVKPNLEPILFTNLLAQLRKKQNLPLAVIGSLLAAVTGALLWALFALVSGTGVSSMAIGVGFLVGSTVHMFGQGVDRSFGRLGAAMSAFGCLLGTCLATWMLVAREAGVSLATVLSHLGLAGMANATIARAHPLDIILYGIAIYEGYIFSFRRLTDTTVHTNHIAQQDG